MTQKSTGLNKNSLSSGAELSGQNFLHPSSSSYNFQIRKQNKTGRVCKASYYLKGNRTFFELQAQRGEGNPSKEEIENGSFPTIVSEATPSVSSNQGEKTGRRPFASEGIKAGSLNSKLSKETELNRRYFIVGERRISSYWWASVFFFGGFGFLITGISSYINYNLFTGVYRNIEALVNNGTDFLKTLGPFLSVPFHHLRALFFSFGDKLEVVSPLLPSSVLGESSLTAPFLIGETGGESLVFFPQGLLLCFYGSLGLLLSLYWWLLIYWNVGGGFNEFNKKEGFMRIFRWGYPGKNRRIDIVYPLKDIEAIRVELNQTPGSGLLASEQTIFIRLLSTPSINNEQTLSGEKNNLTQVGVPNSEKLAEKRVSSFPGSGTTRLVGLDKAKEKREIPLGGIGQPLTLKEIEKQASELANYLQVALEGL